MARQAHSRLIAAGLWLLAGSVAAWMAWCHDSRIALDWERVLGPALLLSLHLLSLVSWELVFLIRRLRVLRPLPPLVALSAWCWAGMPPEVSAGSGARDGPDIVLVTLDTFRGDHVRPDLTPRLLGLADEGVRFTQAVTTAPLTAPAHASMLTGLPVDEHGLLANGRAVEVDTIVPALSEAGYRTGAFISAHVLDRHTELDRGFHHFDDRWGWGQRMNWWPVVDSLDLPRRGHVRGGDETVERALSWLSPDTADFVWVHLYDAHAPYVVPPRWRPSDEAEERARDLDQAVLDAKRGTLTSLVAFLQSAQPETEKLRYRSAIRYTDHLLGTLLDGLDEDTIVLVVGDHGESLDEHGYYFNHGARLWEPSLGVPLVVRWPGALDSGEVRERLVGVSLVHDLVLAAAGLAEIPELETREVLAYTTGQQAHAQAPSPDQVKGPRRGAALRFDGSKLLLHPDREPVWHDLRIDPQELHPQPVPETMQPHLERLRALVDEVPPPLSDEQRRRLEALGYVE
ncbi:MAG TPA: sulfatase-like hydrolase/transferase [Myxococcota bacterium]|nr:sulfatase-like hydrolase/transferase [Myxococcota bacterium]